MSEKEIIIVKLDGKPYETYMDDGVQRFVPNPVVEAFVMNNMDVRGSWDLNDMALKFLTEPEWCTLEQMREFYLQTNYSVSGLLSLSYFEGVEVENPRWER